MPDRLLLPLRSKIAAGLLTAILVLIVGAISYWAVSRAAKSSEQVDHTGRVLLEQGRLLAGLADAETSARGFALTGDSSFLGPFEASRLRVPATIARLRALTTDHPSQQRKLDTLESVALDHLKLNDQIVRFRLARGFELVQRLIASGQGRTVMDNARALTAAMEREENRVLALRIERQKRDVRIAYLVIGIGGGVAFLLSLLINRSIRRDVIDREQQRTMIEKQARQLKKQAEKLSLQQVELSRRLGEQQMLTQELSSSNDSLQAANVATSAEKERAEQALQAAQVAQREQARLARQMSALLESTEAGFYGMNAAGECIFINPAGARMLGFEVDELIGRPLHATIHHTRRDGTPYPIEECPIFLASQAGESKAADDEVFWRKNGTPLSVEYSTSPIFDEGEHRSE